MFIRYLAVFLWLALPGLAGAELLQYRYTDTQGQVKEQPPVQRYGNPSGGEVAIALSGGLDRRVRVELWRGSRRVTAAESEVLGSADRITVAGRDYYGAWLRIPAPPEGDYQVKALLQDLAGNTVQADTYPWTVDTTPPQLGAFQYVGTTSEGSLELFGDVFTNAIVVDKVSDANGIARAEAETVYLEGAQAGQVAVHGAANYDGANQQVSLLQPMRQWYPLHRLQYRLTFTVYDQAGNRSAASLEHRYGSTCGDLPEPVAAHRPGSTAQFLGQAVFAGFEPWANGGVLYENPATLVWRLLRRNWYNETPYGIEFTPVYQDETYVYMKVKKPLLPAPNSNDGNWSTRTTWGCKAYNDFQGTLAEGVGATPQLVSGDIALDGQWIGGRSTWNQKIHVPTTVTRLRAEVEARPYAQVVKVLSTSGTLTCQVPVGATRCEIELAWQPPPERNYYAWQIRLDNEAGEFYAYADYYYFYWDYVAPLIDTVTIDNNSNNATVTVTDPHTTADWRNPWWRPQTVQLLAERRDGSTVTLNPTASRNPTTNAYFYDFNLGQLSESDYTLTAKVVDTFQNERTRSGGDYSADRTPPAIALTVAPDDRPLQRDVTLEVLEDIRIRLTDAIDATPALVAINLSGGPQHDTVNLAWRQDGDSWRLEYPVMFPSLTEGDYQLRVTARDGSGNQTERTATFSYQPHRINLLGGNALSVPVADHAFSRPDGAPAIVTETVALRDGHLLEGRYAIYGTMAGDGLPVVVNGVRVEPGQTVKVAEGYSLGAGRESIRLSLAAPQAGRGQLLLTLPGAPRSPVVQVQITAWTAAAQLTAPSWTVHQVLDALDITAGPAADVPCELTTDQAQAQTAAVFTRPVCQLTWTALPDEGEASTTGPPRITGQAVALGDQRIGWTLTLFDADGSPVTVGGGEQIITVVAPTVPVQPDRQEPVYARVQRLWLGWQSAACELYVDEIAVSARRTDSRPVCLLSWQRLPAGLAQAQGTSRPLLTGYLETPGEAVIGWQLSLFSRRGSRVNLTPEQHTLATQTPPPPTLTLLGDTPLDADPADGQRLAAPLAGGSVGIAQVEAPAGGLTLTLTTPGQEPLTERYEPTRFSPTSRLARTVTAPAGHLWERRQLTVTAAYSRWPEISTSQTITVQYVPDDNLHTVLEAPAEALDNERLPLTLKVGQPRAGELVYDAATMGEWYGQVEVRLRGQQPPQALAPTTLLTAGAHTFAVDIHDRDSLVLYGTARLRSPDGTYTRTLTTLPVYVTVLRAAAPTGRLVSNRALTGAAPLKAAFSLQLDRASQEALGSVHWQVSHDNGATWAALVERTDQRQVSARFPAGRHQVRAELRNRRTGASGYTETLVVQAYAVPELTVVGPRAAFSHKPVTLTARLNQDNQPVTGVIEWWQLDKAGTRQVGSGDTYQIQIDQPQKLLLEARARLPDAPADAPAAWVKARHVLEVQAPAPPVVRLQGPSYMELGTAYPLSATTLLPSPWLPAADYPVRVRWTLPDGRTVEGKTLTYTPTAADLAAGQVEVQCAAWIEDYPQATTRTLTHHANVRQYLWPDFVLETTQRVAAAPAEFSLTVTTPKFVGQLDQPTYQWRWPDGIEPRRVSGARAEVAIARPGSYPVGVTVSDARGNRRELTTVLDAVAAEPFTLTLDLRPSNPHRRAPLDVVVYPQADGGHPKDCPARFRFFLDDHEEPEATTSYARFTGLMAGDHKLRVELESALGVTATARQTLTVVANQPPVCTLRSNLQSGRYYRIEADCNDPDGKVTGYRWLLDGKPVGLAGTRLTLDAKTGAAIVTLTASDDGGSEATVTLTLQ